MDPLSRKLLEELEEMQQQTGRMLRNKAMTWIPSFDTGSRQPAADVYESENEYYVYFDIAGADAQSFAVVVDGRRVRVHGSRRLPEQKSIACIHQLEIELGLFDRTVVLPGYVDVEAVTSEYTDGILTVALPKRQSRARVNIEITIGGR